MPRIAYIGLSEVMKRYLKGVPIRGILRDDPSLYFRGLYLFRKEMSTTRIETLLPFTALELLIKKNLNLLNIISNSSSTEQCIVIARNVECPWRIKITY